MAKTMTVAQMTNALSDYLINNTGLIGRIKSNFVIDGLVTECDITGKPIEGRPVYGLCGVCCSAWLAPGNSKTGQVLSEAYHGARRRLMKVVHDSFTTAERAYFKKSGCPVDAVLTQNYEINRAVLAATVQFAHDVLHLKSVTYHCRID